MKKIRLHITMLILTLMLVAVLPMSAFAQDTQKEPDRIFTVIKQTDEEQPLANAIFELYLVEENEAISGKPTQEELSRYIGKKKVSATLVTDRQGTALLNFSKARLPDGIYLVVEQPNPAMTVEEPFYLSVPGKTEDGSTSYTQILRLKGAVEDAPDIRMDISSINRDSSSFDLGVPQTWIIRADIPDGIGNAREYTITNVLNYRLSYEYGSPLVKLCRKDDMVITLQENIHYVLMEERTEAHGEQVDSFHISLTGAGMQYTAVNLGDGMQHPEIRVYFRSVINTNTAMGSTIPNDAQLRYTNSPGISYQSDSDIPEVHTGGINLRHVDGDGNPIQGTVFMIAREATQAEMETESVLKEVLFVDGKDVAVTYVNFYSEKDLSGGKTDMVTTDAEGNATLYGLAYGTYYLVEIQPAEGFNQAADPIVIRINETSHLTASDGWWNSEGELVDNTWEIVNRKYILPNTGGVGTHVFTALGIFLMTFAYWLMTGKKRIAEYGLSEFFRYHRK